VPRSSPPRSADKLAAAVQSLMALLSGRDGLRRQLARRSLVAIGEPALEPLTAALRDRDLNVRWEAAKALGEMGDPTAAPALVRALEDKAFGVRWLAAEALISFGRDGLAPLLRALAERPDSPWLREGAHHVLRFLANRGLQSLVGPLVATLERVEDLPAIVADVRSLLNAVSEEKESQR
jgi:HEAT repeat protein